LAAGVASRSTDQLVANLRAAGELLRSVADAGDRMQVSRRILDVAYKLDQERSSTAEADAPAQPEVAAEADVVPIRSLEFDAEPESERDVVPIASLAPDIEPVAVTGGLEISFRTLEHLQRERGSSPASLEALLGRVEQGAAAPPAADAVAIEALCYRGRSALERAATVRQSLTTELAGVSDLAAIRPLLLELLDLVPLALDES
jgi:hypothetical protein